SQAATKNKDKAIANSSPPTYDPEPEVVADADASSKEKEIDKLMALILMEYDNQREVNVVRARANIGTQVVQQTGIQCYNCKEFGHVAREYDEPKDQELEAHYMYMAKIQEVTPDAADNSGPIFDEEPLQKVHNSEANYNVFANERQQPKQPESVNDTYLMEQGDTNITHDSSVMSNNGEEADQDDHMLKKERELLASLIEQLKVEIDGSKQTNKSLESSNKALKEANKFLQSELTSFVNPEFLKKAQSVNPRLYDIGCYNDNLALMLAPESDETICLGQESRLKLIIFPQMKTIIEQKLHPTATCLSNAVALKQEMVKDLKHFKSLENKVESLQSQLETQKTQFSNEIDRISREYNYVDHMNEILGVYTKLDEVTNLQCDYLEIKNDKAWKQKESSLFRELNDKFFEIQDLKAQLQDKNIAISELKKLIEKIKEKYVETKFDKSLVVSRPQLKSNRLEDRVLHNNSQWKKKKVEDHRRIFKFSNNKTSVTACNDSLNVKTLNVNFVCVTCGKCMLHDNHDMCVLHYINGVNSRTKKPIVVPISTREPKRKENQSVATTHKKIVALEPAIKKPRSIFRKLYEHIILFIVDSGCSKHMTGNLKLLRNFMEKFLGTMKFENDQIAPILSYGDLVQGNITIKRVYYVKGLNHNLFLVGQFCDVDLEVAFRKSTCYVRDLKGNDLLIGSRGLNLYSITLQDTYSPNPTCLMAKASSSQAWLWHRRLSHLNFDTINLLSKNDIVIGLLKLIFVKDYLCSSCELGKAKRKSFKTKTTPSSKRRLQLLHMDLCGPMRVESINGKKYMLVIVDDYSRYTWTHFLRSKDETPKVLIAFIILVQRGLHAQVTTVRTGKGTKFLNKTLHEYFSKEGIEYQTSVA
ncbi:retrovirus-related pol polyprotein from transposon TNT 1-94, partial [Tanacetum coccineum]